ncbi:hypothetical protein [Halorubellus litoreus]|uniref:Uncharacterized protein n=1 Tax=Halorubellus litoreus TaxID=755308 RepID=A0ABD5VDC4_9EURY
MGENDVTVLVAMPPTERRGRIVELIGENGHDVRTADDGVRAVDRIRHADVVLVGGYPPQVARVVLDATTPPGVVRPNVLVADDADAFDTVPGDHLPADATAPAVADAVEAAVGRANYTRRVAAFSAVAAEAAKSDRPSHALAEQVAGLASDARSVQTDFSPTDWTAAFRSVLRTDASALSSKSGNRTS